MKILKHSLVVVGSGLAGLYAALRASEKSNTNDILLLTKSKLQISNSFYAQGGIVAVLKSNKLDSTKLHTNDTIKAGAGLSDELVTEKISLESDDIIKDLINKGVDFDKDENGNIALTLEAAHSVRRILHVGGDSTGRFISEALIKDVLADKNIQVFEYTQAVKLLTDEDNNCRGLIAFNQKTKEHFAVSAKAVIIATGGIGQLYTKTTNPVVSTGDGISIAYDAGATLQDMEFVQFHPTAFFVKNKGFLISEAVRGEGAKLKNYKADEFAHKYNEKAELAPRDIVTRAIYFEMQNTGSDKIYLDATKIDEAKLSKRFPQISATCLNNGIDISKDMIPVSPAAHYFMGGIKVDMKGRTNIHNLYATGEVACTSLHGANRLASNSLLECAVLSNEIIKNLDIKSDDFDITKSQKISIDIEKYEKQPIDNANDIDSMKNSLKEIMWNFAGIIRNEDKLNIALSEIQKMKTKFSGEVFSSISAYELHNMLCVAEIIVKCAVNRKESRGAHYREDYKELLPDAKHSYIKKDL